MERNKHRATWLYTALTHSAKRITTAAFVIWRRDVGVWGRAHRWWGSALERRRRSVLSDALNRMREAKEEGKSNLLSFALTDLHATIRGRDMELETLKVG